MLIHTNKSFVREYTKLSDSLGDVRHFRLYYSGEATNLIWYDGQIVYIPQEYFELKNLVNIDLDKRVKCCLYKNDIELIEELKKKKIVFLLESNLEELINGIEMSGLPLSDELGIEMIDDKDYAIMKEPIYLENGVWLRVN